MSAGEFEGQLAIVTGGAGGIGAAIATALAAGGATLALVDNRDVAIEEFIKSARRPDQRITAWPCDVTSSAEVRDVCERIGAEFGPASILVNNVGGSGSHQIEHVEDMTDEAWDHVLSLNLGSIMRFCRALVPAMKARRYGRIVNVSSTVKEGMMGPPGTIGARIPYVTAKSGIVGMTKQLAKDLGPFGITVNAIAPGFTLPGEEARITRKFRALPPDDQRRLTSNIPVGRPGTGEDMAHAVCFLASPKCGYVTGEIVAVAGGA